MKKLLSFQEIKQSLWPGRFSEVFGDNLVSAFLYGDCLEEGFSALENPWTVAFILGDGFPGCLPDLRSDRP